MSDWYSRARQEFLYDLALFNDVTPEVAQKIYSYLFNEGVVDYDIEKEYLYDNYVEEDENGQS